ncbi:MAG TPA: Lsr2 family protein [Nocardioidaceae bacterium]|nr:Lsr2 family protein [Nocardioidaceae bacterium]
MRAITQQPFRWAFQRLADAVQQGGTLAQRVITQLVSDLSGDEVVEGKGETVEFSYRGTSYTIDLTDKEAAGFDRAMAMYIDHATKTGGARKRTAAPSASTAGRSRGELQNIRAWARENGYDVSERGRIKAEIVAAYHSSN